MKTILYVFHCSTIGGGSYCLLSILKNIDRTKYFPKVLLAYEGPLADEIRKLNIEVLFYQGIDSVPYNLSLWKRGTIAKYCKIEKSLSGYIEIVKRINPDLVYLNSMMLYPYLKPTKEAGYKTVIHIREHWPLNQHSKQLRRVQNFIQKYANHVVVINKFAANQVPNIEDKTTVVYDWIDLADRDKAISMSDIFQEDLTNKKVLLFTGGRAPNKGAKEVAELFSKRLIDKDLRLLVLGNSVMHYGKSFKERVKMWLSDKGIRSFYGYELNNIIKSDNRIVCIPNVYEIKPLLDQCTCLVSFFTIPHANLALAEGIINNTVVVAAKTEESMEYTMNGDLAFLFNINDGNEFVNAVETALKNNCLMKKKLSEKSVIIQKMFSKERNVCALNKVYETVLFK